MPAQGARRSPGEHDTAPPRLGQQPVEAVSSPDGQQVHETAAAHPDDVLRQEVRAHVGDVGMREQPEVRRLDPGGAGRLEFGALDVALVTTCRVDVGDARRASVHLRQVDGVVQQRTVHRVGPLAAGQPAARGENGRFRRGHSFTAPSLEFMIRRWKMKNSTATGMVMIAAAASFSGY